MTARGTWKASERAFAKTLGGKRIPVTGLEKWDIETPEFVVEHKYGKAVMSATLRHAWEQILSADDDRIPLVTFEQSFGQGVTAFRGVVLRLEDFETLLTMIRQTIDSPAE